MASVIHEGAVLLDSEATTLPQSALTSGSSNLSAPSSTMVCTPWGQGLDTGVLFMAKNSPEMYYLNFDQLSPSIHCSKKLP